MGKLTRAMLLLLAAQSLGGCVLAAAAGVGYMIHDEATEGDGEFDPLEKVFDDD
jgi:hypothetical protein